MTKKKLERQLGTMDRILAVMGVFLFLFVLAMIIIFCLYQATPDTLIVSVFGVSGVECGVMGAIKNRKESIRAQIREMEETEKEGS